MSLEENKEVARMYHDLNPDDMDKILTPGFVGHHQDGSTWNLESHKRFWSQQEMKDIVHMQIAEGEWVATRATRTGTYQGKPISVDFMQFKRFEGDKIAEVWELFNSKQSEQ